MQSIILNAKWTYEEDNNIDKCTYHDKDIYKSAEHKELRKSNTIYNKMKMKFECDNHTHDEVMNSSNEIET